jgi:2-oxoglutarate ferredoxin oxidoreductase subunit alpha
MKRYKKILVPEMNLGQLAFILRGRYLVDAISYSKVEGKPFKQSEIEKKVLEVIK